jgi:hypothetical protein
MDASERGQSSIDEERQEETTWAGNLTVTPAQSAQWGIAFFSAGA